MRDHPLLRGNRATARSGAAHGGQRSYGDSDRRRLTFIRQCREFGFPIEQVRSLVALTEDDDRSCMEARSIAQVHVDAVRERLAELKGLERNLTDFIKRCDALCSGGPAAYSRSIPPPITTSPVAPDRPSSDSGSGRFAGRGCATVIGAFTSCSGAKAVVTARTRRGASIAN